MRANGLGCLQRGGPTFPQSVIICRLLLMVPGENVEPEKIIFRSLVKTEQVKVQHRQSNVAIFHCSIEHALCCYFVSV